MSTISEHDITVDGLRVHLHDWVPEGPRHNITVVYLHGMADSGACSAELGRALNAHGFRAVFPDAPGHGGSELGAEWTEWTRAAAALAVVEQYVGEPVVLGGHSMGGETAAIVTSQRPDLVRALLLEEPAMWFEDGTVDEITDSKKRFRDWIVGLQTSTQEERVEWVRDDGPRWDEVEYGPWAEAKAAMNLGLFDVPYSWLSSGWYDVARAISVPTLLVRGAPSDHTMSAVAAQQFCELVPQTVDVVAETGHCVRRDEPLAFTRMMLGLLTPFA